MALNRRSRVITEGHERSANRARLYPVGFTPKDFGKPIVGVAHGHLGAGKADLQLCAPRRCAPLRCAQAPPPGQY